MKTRTGAARIWPKTATALILRNQYFYKHVVLKYCIMLILRRSVVEVCFITNSPLSLSLSRQHNDTIYAISINGKKKKTRKGHKLWD